MDLEKLLEKLNTDPKNLDLLCDTGKKYKEVGDFNSAKMYFMKALEINPDHCPATCSMVHLLVDNGYYKEAFDIFNEEAKRHKDDENYTATLFNALFALYLLHNINLAQLKGAPPKHNYEELFFKIGSTFLSYGLYDAASKVFESAYIISNSNVRLILNLSECYLKTDNPNKAEELLLDLEKRLPEDRDVLAKLCELYRNIQDYISSKRYSKKLLELEPLHLLANNTLAYIYLVENKINKAISIYQKLITKDNNDYQAYKNLFLAYRVGNNPKEAQQLLDDLMINKPEFAYKIRDEVEEKLEKDNYLN